MTDGEDGLASSYTLHNDLSATGRDLCCCSREREVKVVLDADLRLDLEGVGDTGLGTKETPLRWIRTEFRY